MTDLEFPSVQYFYHEQRRNGARVELVPSGNSVRFDLDAFLAAIDETTLLVPISLVLFRSSFIVNAKAIIEKAHRVGAHVILDVFQATGTVPVDVFALGADFAVGGVLKWLCGGPGVAYLYVREDLRKKLLPALTGWFAHRRPFQFEVGAIDAREDSFRFLNGTTHVPALYACQPGLEILNQVGVQAIRAKSIGMTTRLLEGVRERGWRVNTAENAAERGRRCWSPVTCGSIPPRTRPSVAARCLSIVRTLMKCAANCWRGKFWWTIVRKRGFEFRRTFTIEKRNANSRLRRLKKF